MNARIIDEITKFVFIQDEMDRSDIIFIPGGSHPELGEYAAELFKKGFTDKIMPSGGVSIKSGKFGGVKSKTELYGKDYQTDCEFLTDVLMQNGVPFGAIIQEDRSGFTKENAYFSRAAADARGLVIRKAIICCKCFHARRSLMAYQFAFPDTEFLVHPIPYFEKGIEIGAGNWYKSEAGIRRVLGEMQRYGNQFVDEFLGVLPQQQ